MTDNKFDEMVKKLELKIHHDEEKIYSKQVIDEFNNPIFFGILEKPDATGHIAGPCGDTMKITISIKQEKIKKSLFWTDGCGATIACGNMLMKMIQGKTIQQAKKITNKQLINELHGLPENHRHCATLACNTLHHALKQLNTT